LPPPETRMRRLLALVLALTIAVPALAQDGWKKGYIIIKSSGQKLEGKVREQGDKILFENEKGTVKLEFDPADVKVTVTEKGGDQAASPGSRLHKIVEVEKFDGTVYKGECIDEKVDTI